MKKTRLISLIFIMLLGAFTFFLIGCERSGGGATGSSSNNPQIIWTSSIGSISHHSSPFSGSYEMFLRFKNIGNKGETEFKVSLIVGGTVKEKSQKFFIESNKEYTLRFYIGWQASSGNYYDYVMIPITISSPYAAESVELPMHFVQVNKFTLSLWIGDIKVE